MKWVQVRPGHYKTVDDSDERPAVSLKRNSIGSFSTKFSPSWKKYEEHMMHQESKDQKEATDKFIIERDHEIKTNPTAKRWEESRKARVAKDKPAWRKEMVRKGII